MQAEQKRTITELAELLHTLKLSEIEYEENGVHLRVVGEKSVPGTVIQPAVAVKSEPIKQTNSDVQKKDPVKHICSPMVGVAYLTKDEHSPAFVKVGDHVSVGQTVCLIEAMKTFNPIKADKAGTIAEILIESGSPVEYNQPLFSVA